MERFVARIPALLMAAFVALCAYVAFVEPGEARRFAAAVPLLLLLAAYLRAGRAARGRAG